VNASGVVSGAGATVVVVNTSDTPHIVRVVFVDVELAPELVCLTATVSPLFTVHATLVHVPLLFISYSHVATDIADAVFIHATVIAADSVNVLNAVFV
jgi:hypothetical protein